MRRRYLSVLACLSLALLADCAAAQSRDPRSVRAPTTAAEGLEFELVTPRDQAFQIALSTLVQFGIPVTEASAASGTIKTGKYQFNAQTEAHYVLVISGSDRLSRIVMKGWFSAPTLGVANEPIVSVEHGYRTKLWKHFSRLARAIETQPMGVVVPAEEIHISPPDE